MSTAWITTLEGQAVLLVGIAAGLTATIVQVRRLRGTLNGHLHEHHKDMGNGDE